jgi:hypothetical protein
MSFVLIPTCDTHVRVCEMTAALLDRYWPEHPPVHVLHYDVQPRIRGAMLHYMGNQGDSPWLATITRFLRTRRESVFLLLLDDYALCGPPRRALISAAVELFQSDPRVGLFPLCWYPASSRKPRADWPGIVTLGRCPILLQAALWRREWFLELAEGMDGNTSPWGFESAATQRAKQVPREICAADMPDPPYVGGHLIDAFDKRDWPLPYHNLMHAGKPDQRHDEFLRREGFEVTSRGLGDTIAKVTRATGFDRVARAVERVTGRPCGCEGRRTALNTHVPY